jgi:hypothetical protein
MSGIGMGSRVTGATNRRFVGRFDASGRRGAPKPRGR